MATQGRNNAIDLVKILMAILVISIHTITPSGIFDYLLTQSVARVAVPFFFIAAGYFFPSNPKQADIKKALFRLATLYIAWCVFYLPFEISDISTKPLSASGYFWESLYIFAKGWRHLWFMPALMLGMVVYYLLHSNKKVNIIAFSLYAIGFMVQLNIEHGEYSILFYRNFLTFGFPLIAMGAALKKQRPSFKTGYPVLATLLLLTVMLLLEGFVRLKSGIYDNDLLLLAPLVAVYAFMLTLKVDINLPLNIACTASSIYFIHYFFYLTLKYHISNQILLFLAVSVLSLFFSLTLNKLNIYRRFFT
ncbi:acyltransferase family protein [Pantoea sp. GD03673]|uniref:acyltransferase family protein n=1 Tax=Pantoea sp. GD03673 TaxID=2975364 RepID=UPI0024479245|nr:acyltransferase family protein [Pantoea sp. GD03673]MDH2066566.1 acyltransferase [Pantoea sp. GD03673]